MPAFNLRDVEFKSDGLVDSLTLAMSPQLFHENLKREIAIASREARELTVVSLTLDITKFSTLAEIQEVLIEIAHLLKGELRGGDFFSRISDCGFWILLRTDEAGADLVMQRLDLPRRENLTINIAARKLSDYREWIERLDPLHFN
jgi:GGDEF domain-containing protein